TPMDFRLDAGLPAAESVLELERLAHAAGKGTVGTVGELEVSPGIINVVPAEAHMSIDVRGVDEEGFRGVALDIAAFAEQAADKRGMTATFNERQNLPATHLDERIVSALEAAARETQEPY